MKHLIIDFDTYIFKAITASKILIRQQDNIFLEGYDLNLGITFLLDTIKRLTSDLHARMYTLVIGDKENFRKKLYPTYKANRPSLPNIWYELMKVLSEDKRFNLISLPNLEADDTCRIIFEDKTYYPDDDKIIVSVDKDFYSVPCKLFRDLPNPSLEFITPEKAKHNLAKQIIMGDNTDNYQGIKGYGIKTTEKFLANNEVNSKNIIKLYEDNKLTKDDYTMNRICASIISIDDYDMRTGEVNTKKDYLD